MFESISTDQHFSAKLSPTVPQLWADDIYFMPEHLQVNITRKGSRYDFCGYVNGQVIGDDRYRVAGVSFESVADIPDWLAPYILALVETATAEFIDWSTELI